MIKNLFILCLFFVTFSLQAQVNLITAKDLNKRIKAAKDTTYVINFWATWCGPCVEELPSFEKLNTKYKNKPFKVLLISLDLKSKKETIVEPFVKNHKIASEVYILNEKNQFSFFKKLDITWNGTIPATMFINPKNKIMSFYNRPFANYKDLTNYLATIKLMP